MREGAGRDSESDLTAEPHEVFFSYSRVNQDRALPMIEAIKAAGYTVWWDGLLEGGTEFLEQTEQALEAAKAVVVLWSAQSVASHWVRDEATSGRERDRLVPLTLDGTMPPLGFRQVQVIDMSDWPKLEAGLDAVLKVLEKLRDDDTSSQPKFTPIINPRGTVAPSSSRRALLIGAASVIGAAAVGGGWALRGRGRTMPTSAAIRSIAVMPFEDRVRDEALSYVADGVGSAIRDGLSGNPLLQVTARSSSAVAQTRFETVTEIAEALGVGHIIQGRFERGDSRPEFFVQMIEGGTGVIVSSNRYPYIAGRVLTVQDAILTDIMARIGDPPEKPTDNPQAYDQYLRGRQWLSRGITTENVQNAIVHFERAVTLDPGFTNAFTNLAEQKGWLGITIQDKARSVRLIDEALDAAQTAVSLSPQNASVHVALGNVQMSYRADIRKASDAFTTAEQIGLTRADDIARVALFRVVTGASEDALEEARQGLILDPLSAFAHYVLALCLYASRQYEKSAAIFEQVLEIEPNFYAGHAWIALSRIYGGDDAAGLETCQFEPNLMERHTCEAIAQARLSNMDASDAALQALVDAFGDSAAYQQVQILAQQGREALALQAMEKAVRLQDSGLSLASFDPALDPLRNTEAFQALLVSLGYTP